MWAISIGSGITGVGLSLYTRTPVITAWSTPGAALLTSALADYPYAEAIGAFVVAGILMAVVGVTGVFGRILDRIPPAIVAAMLAGILFPLEVPA